MGSLIKVKCEKCGYEELLSVGAGLCFNKLENVVDLFDENSGKLIKRAAADNPKALWSATKEMAVCDRCQKVRAVAVFRSKDASGRAIQVRSRCECEGEVNIKDYEKVLMGKEPLGCPKCKSLLKAETIGNWD